MCVYYTGGEFQRASVFTLRTLYILLLFFHVFFYSRLLVCRPLVRQSVAVGTWSRSIMSFYFIFFYNFLTVSVMTASLRSCRCISARAFGARLLYPSLMVGR